MRVNTAVTLGKKYFGHHSPYSQIEECGNAHFHRKFLLAGLRLFFFYDDGSYVRVL